MMDLCIGNGQLHQVQLTEVVGALNCMHDQQAILRGGGGDMTPKNEQKGGDGMMDVSTNRTVVRRLTPL